MNATSTDPAFLFRTLAQTAPVSEPANVKPLMRMEDVVDYIGDDPATQRIVFHLCLDLIITSLPRLRQAVDSGDIPTLKQLAHHTRGSLSMLGLPSLRELGEQIEYHYDDLGAECWRQRCEALYKLLTQLSIELQEHLAA
jgi:HPt (histidine-containing phosphotransfer) domain-containing protein